MNITVTYGVRSAPLSIPEGTTYRQVVDNTSLQSVLNYGDNVKALVNGVEQPMGAAVQDGTTVQLETRANSKALRS